MPQQKESLQKLYLEQLRDLFSAEDQILEALPKMTKQTTHAELKRAFQEHYQQTEQQVQRLQRIFDDLGVSPEGEECEGMKGLLKEGEKTMDEFQDSDVLDAALIAAAQRVEHYEMAGYGCARTYAHRLNRPDEARLLQETLDEEGRADHRLTEIAEAHVNDDARSEADLHQPAAAKRLRYVDGRQLDYRRLSDGTLEVRNDADDKLGVFDGLMWETMNR